VAIMVCTMMHQGCASTAVIAAAGVTAGFGLAQGQAESFITGELKAARLVPMDAVLRATIMAMDEMQLHIIEQRTSDHDAYVMAKAQVGPEFKVKLKAKSPMVTKISIRIGIMGDQAVSRLVLTRIDVKLGIEQPIVPVEVSPIVAPPASRPAWPPTPAAPP
jgi:hypothetical protein